MNDRTICQLFRLSARISAVVRLWFQRIGSLFTASLDSLSLRRMGYGLGLRV